MVSTLILMLGLWAAEPSGALGVVRVPRGEVYVSSTAGASEPARVGALLGHGQGVDVEEDGWAELLLLDDTRLRLSGGTSLRLEHGAAGGLVVSVQRGRLWVQKSLASPLRLELHAPGLRVEVLPASSIIVEHTTLSGGSCVVRAGEARVSADDRAPLLVPAGMIARRARPDDFRTGGQTIGDLVSKEARSGLGDLTGLTAFIVERTLKGQVAEVDMRGVAQLFHGDVQLMGGSHSTLILERAVRPPPFDPSEVPRRGANVEVEVRFEDR